MSPRSTRVKTRVVWRANKAEPLGDASASDRSWITVKRACPTTAPVRRSVATSQKSPDTSPASSRTVGRLASAIASRNTAALVRPRIAKSRSSYGSATARVRTSTRWLVFTTISELSRNTTPGRRRGIRSGCSIGRLTRPPLDAAEAAPQPIRRRWHRVEYIELTTATASRSRDAGPLRRRRPQTGGLPT